MGNSFFKTRSASELLKITSHPDFYELVSLEHSRVMSWDNFGMKTIINFCAGLDFEKDNWNIPQIVIKSSETRPSICADYVDGFKDNHGLICTQTPTENRWETFFKLVWSQKTCVIVSLTDISRDNQECYQLWMNLKGSEVTYGKYVIRILEITEEINFTKIQLRITHTTTEASREITNFWFFNWPDSNTSTDLKEFLDFRRAVYRKQYMLIDYPENDFLMPEVIVVHSTPGSGWTETFCVIDSAVAQVYKEKRVSLPRTVVKMRSQIHSSVFLPEQYALCYKILEHVFLAEGKRLK